MNDDPVKIALRRDAALLIELSPPPDAAALWHTIRRARARRIQLIMDISGWTLRAAIVAIFLGLALTGPNALLKLAAPLALVGWLSRGMCSPVLPASLVGGRARTRRYPVDARRHRRRSDPNPN
jgi:hypothetical protein